MPCLRNRHGEALPAVARKVLTDNKVSVTTLLAVCKPLLCCAAQGLQGGPHNHTIAALAVALKQAKTPEFTTYQQQVVANCHALSERMQQLGYTIVSGELPCLPALWRLGSRLGCHPSTDVAALPAGCCSHDARVNGHALPACMHHHCAAA